MSKSSKEQLEALHGELARVLIEAIKSGEATAAVLNVARQMLKDNGIDSVAAPGSPVRDLADLPVFGNTDHHLPHMGPMQ